MYIIILVIAALLFAVSEVLESSYYNSIFLSWKPEKFWNPHFRKDVLRVKVDSDILVDNEDLLTKPYWYSAVNIFVYLGFLFLIIAATLAQLPIFQIRGFSIVWQIIICAALFLTTYNYAVYKLFIKKRI